MLRIEDLDGPRIKPGAAASIQSTLQWLGIDWDHGPFVQSDDLDPYRLALARLARAGAVYPCDLSRQEIAASASAPQQGSGESHFPPELRPPAFVAGTPQTLAPAALHEGGANWRFATPPGPITFTDELAGPQAIDPALSVGDFVVWTKRGTPAYQFAVVVDDARQGVTDVVRGDDLLDSAARQLRLYRALGLAPEPRYWHLPLVTGPDGRRLAKRHGDTRVESYRAMGVPAEAVVGLIAYWSGAAQARDPMTPAQLVERLDVSTIPRTPVTFTAEDDQWLRQCA